jgi:hypothetical protein
MRGIREDLQQHVVRQLCGLGQADVTSLWAVVKGSDVYELLERDVAKKGALHGEGRIRDTCVRRRVR